MRLAPLTDDERRKLAHDLTHQEIAAGGSVAPWHIEMLNRVAAALTVEMPVVEAEPVIAAVKSLLTVFDTSEVKLAPSELARPDTDDGPVIVDEDRPVVAADVAPVMVEEKLKGSYSPPAPSLARTRKKP